MKIKLKDLVRNHVKHILSTMSSDDVKTSIRKLDRKEEYGQLNSEDIIRYSEFIISWHCRNYHRGSDDIINDQIKKLLEY